ncbi:MAG TPA: hypothetical protein VMX94_10380 [Armatimonadota bacterium]|nr:hypothetical protein [Armatimonadota bacterium]
MPGYFDATTEAELAADWHGQDATQQAVAGLPRMMDNFDSSIARMEDARKTLLDADASLVEQESFKKMGAGLITVLAAVTEYVDQCRPGSGDAKQGTIPSVGAGARMRSGS